MLQSIKWQKMARKPTKKQREKSRFIVLISDSEGRMTWERAEYTADDDWDTPWYPVNGRLADGENFEAWAVFDPPKQIKF